MSRPTITISPSRAISCCCSTIRSRTPGTLATTETAASTALLRRCGVASAPSTAIDAVSGLPAGGCPTLRSTASASRTSAAGSAAVGSGRRPRSMAAQVSARYMIPVSSMGQSSRSATALPITVLPDATGPSIATTRSRAPAPISFAIAPSMASGAVWGRSGTRVSRRGRAGRPGAAAGPRAASGGGSRPARGRAAGWARSARGSAAAPDAPPPRTCAAPPACGPRS